MSLSPWRETLLDAARYVQKHGWCKGIMKDVATGKVCAYGALYFASNGDNEGPNYTARLRAREQFEKYVGWSMLTWNDHKCRSKKQVIETFETVANQGLKKKRKV